MFLRGEDRILGSQDAKEGGTRNRARGEEGTFPCLDRGTDGYAQLFRQILREGFSLY